MKTKLTGIAASALGAGALVLGGAATASAASVPAQAPTVSAHASVVRPNATWTYYGTYSTLAECDEAGDVVIYDRYPGYECLDVQRTTVDLFQLWVFTG